MKYLYEMKKELTDEERKEIKKAYNKKYYEKIKERDKEERKIKSQEYRKNNPDKVKESRDKWDLKNIDKVIKYTKTSNKNYRTNNKEKINNNLNKYNKERKKIDSLFKLTCNLRSMIYRSLKEKNYSKNSRSHDILGCSFEEFKLYLETKFESWMNWGNYGLYNGELNYGWDIDHIIPLSSAITEEELLKLNHFSNLQPLCSYINRYIKKDIIN